MRLRLRSVFVCRGTKRQLHWHRHWHGHWHWLLVALRTPVALTLNDATQDIVILPHATQPNATQHGVSTYRWEMRHSKTQHSRVQSAKQPRTGTRSAVAAAASESMCTRAVSEAALANTARYKGEKRTYGTDPMSKPRQHGAAGDLTAMPAGPMAL